jgi:hypothetical protein
MLQATQATSAYRKAIEEADTYLISYKLSEIGYKGVQA